MPMPMPALQGGEARAARLPGRQSALHQLFASSESVEVRVSVALAIPLYRPALFPFDCPGLRSSLRGPLRAVPSGRNLGPVADRPERLPGYAASRRVTPRHATFRGECIGFTPAPRLASMKSRPKSRSAWYWLWAAQRSSTLSASWHPPIANGLLW